MSGDSKIKVGSRKSELALIQTKHVISLLKQCHTVKEFEIVTMSTLGDQILDVPLPKIGEKSLFTKELETALALGQVDFIVHSLKDLPTCLPEGMAIGAVLPRENPRDSLVLQKDIKDHTLGTLPKGSVIGTSSLRRTAQLAKKYPHLLVENIRGNLNTRLKKLDDLGKYQAIILASAGLIRMGWKSRISRILDTEEMLYAVGQGAIAVECRSNDERIIKLLEPLYDLQTALRVISERSFLKTLGGGCSAPVAVMSDLKLLKENEVEIYLKGAVWSLDGKEEVLSEENASINVLTSIRCTECPYSNGNKVIDIECCIVCPMSPTKEPNPKRQKLNIPTEVLENDPHEKCPVPLPIGSDFMGQCPYLEGDIQTLHNRVPLNGPIEGIQDVMKMCPFLVSRTPGSSQPTEAQETESVNVVQIKSENDELFVGLLPHKDITRDNMKKATFLGEQLAKKLMEQGALRIMAKAQAAVHGHLDFRNIFYRKIESTKAELGVMGKHAEWRKSVKKLRRKRLRQAKARDRDQKLLKEQQRLQDSPQYNIWLEEQEKTEKQNEEEEARQAAHREEMWRKVEEEAQKQWQELQKKIALAREEKMKQNIKIKLEWEKEQQKLKALQAAKERELEETRRLQAHRENELLDFLEKGGDTPEHLKTTLETNPGKQTCPFFHKVSACRFFDGCSRNHVRPGISRTLLIPNFFSDISLETKENEHGSDSTLEFENEDTYDHYKEFFYDVVSELEQCGNIRNFQTCCNHEAHLRGNVYVEYCSTREALISYHRFNGRWYGGKQLNVEFCTIENWKNAICGLFHRNRCPKGNACNFLHVFRNPRNVYSTNEEYSDRHRSQIKSGNSDRKKAKKPDGNDSWDGASSERRNWRWSESPEHVPRKDDPNKNPCSHNTRHRRDRDGASKRQLKRKRNPRSRSKSVSSRNKAPGSRKSTSPEPTRRRRRRSRRRCRKSEASSDRSLLTANSTKSRSS